MSGWDSIVCLIQTLERAVYKKRGVQNALFLKESYEEK